MSIESDAQKDLALNDEVAENVVGGKAWKKARKATTSHAAAAGSNYIHVTGGPPGGPVPFVDSGNDDCADPADATT